MRQGWEAAMAALFTESIFCALSAGFYGPVVQTLKDAEPQALTGVFLTAVLPVTFQAPEYLLHWFRGTPHLHSAGRCCTAVGIVVNQEMRLPVPESTKSPVIAWP
jgi:hypothetical protein